MIYTIGMFVVHNLAPGLGTGEIIQVQDKTLVIRFDRAGIQEYDSSITPLKIVRITCEGHRAILENYLQTYDFQDAENYFNANSEFLEYNAYVCIRESCKSKYYCQEMQKLLEAYRFNEASEYYLVNKEYIVSDWYGKTEKYYRLRCDIEKLWQSHQFEQADNLYKQHVECFSIEEYVAKKAEHIKSYTQKIFCLNKPLDGQQSHALADVADNLLVTARAGSGKTTVLTCKGMLLAACKYVDNPDSILMLAFNRKAADKIRERINIKYKMPLKNIRTFHSLAHRIVQPTQDIKEDYENEMAVYLKTLLQNDPRLKPYLYEFFKKEMEDIDYKGLLLNETEYYSHAKYYWQSISLAGNYVKSYGEKCIADFLFEHGLSYEYESSFPVFEEDNPVIYKPDFTIYDSGRRKTFILEHWAIPNKGIYRSDVPIWNHSNKTEHQYAQERDKKRNYWNRDYWRNREHYLIETDISWLVNGRDEFENKIKRLLESKGVECSKLPEKELLEKVYKNCSNHLYGLFVKFIQKCRRYGYTPQSIKEKRDEYITENEKEKVFLRVAPEIYEKYEKSLDDSDKVDFDRLVYLAIEKIHETRGECYICDNKNNVNIKVKDLKYILIDEFQDFSKMFYDVISVIKAVNPEVKLFCVGDDWQAINGFAGSDLKYFNKYEDCFSETSRRNILTNYRSGSHIIEAGNQLMDGLGEKAQRNPVDSTAGTVERVNIENYHIEGRNSQDGTEQHSADKKYLQACEIKIPTKDGGERKVVDYDTARYLKAIHGILEKNISMLSQVDKTCLVLTRRNRFGCFKESENLKQKILEVFSKNDKNHIGINRIEEKIHVMTAHKSKGKEADIVFVLKCNIRNFPMVHPDNRLFGIFDETEEKSLAEEKRLFYVAITRAKQKVYLLTEEDDKSPFLERIGINNVTNTIIRQNESSAIIF